MGKKAGIQRSGKANMPPPPPEDAFATHMRFLDAETERSTLSDVLTAPIFTKPVQEHVLANKNYHDKPFAQYGLLAGDASGSASDPRLFFNVAAPSSTFICGSQGSGKSHTLSCLLENCLVQNEVNMLPRPLTGIVFHYDTFVSDAGGSPCEAAFLSSHQGVDVRVLCAPTNVGHITKMYQAKLPHVKVEALRINQSDLNTQRMLDLMAVPSVQGSLPLYLHVVARILRDLRIDQQTRGTQFDYAEFKRRLDGEALTDGQLAPLQQRLETLESFMVLDQALKYDMFNKNRTVGRGEENQTAMLQSGNSWAPKAGQLTIVDLSCPCVTAEMACSLFGICLSLFLEQNTKVGRIVALDEAHKYMTDSAECRALTESLLSTIRLQRHIATRVVVSTQEPTISPRLLDLCSVTIVHRFTSPNWMLALRKHLAGASSWLDADAEEYEHSGKGRESKVETGIRPLISRKTDVVADLFSKIVKLRTGEALMFAPSAVIDLETTTTTGGHKIEPKQKGREGSIDTDDSTYDSPALSKDGYESKDDDEPPKLPVFTFGTPNEAPKPKMGLAHQQDEDKRVTHLGDGVLKVRIRKRITKDGGESIMAG